MTSPRFLTFKECSELQSGYLVTVNLQHMYECRHNAALRHTIFADPNARLCLDGRGAQIIFQRWSGKRLPLAAGNEILKARLERGGALRVLVVGSDAAAIADVQRRFHLIEFVHAGSRIPYLDKAEAARCAASLVQRFGVNFNVLAIALGVPKQEMLGSALASQVPNVPILCIGGSFEMLAGRHRRAPLFVQRFGLEGVWRLLVQPSPNRLARLARSYWYFLMFLANPRRVGVLTGSTL